MTLALWVELCSNMHYAYFSSLIFRGIRIYVGGIEEMQSYASSHTRTYHFFSKIFGKIFLLYNI